MTTRRLLLPKASEVTPRSPRWVWADRLPQGHASVLAGPTGIGKSTLACGLAAQATRGTLPGDLEGTPVEVALISAEDDESTTIVPRLAAARADLDRVRLPRFEDDGPSGFPSDGAALVAGLAAEGISILVIDTGPSFLDAVISSNNEQDVRAALGPLVAAGRDHGLTTIVLLHVTTKATKAAGLGRILGSTAWVAFPRSVLLLDAADSDDETNPGRVLSHLKSNLGPRQRPIAVRIEPVIDELADDRANPSARAAPSSSVRSRKPAPCASPRSVSRGAVASRRRPG